MVSRAPAAVSIFEGTQFKVPNQKNDGTLGKQNLGPVKATVVTVYSNQAPALCFLN